MTLSKRMAGGPGQLREDADLETSSEDYARRFAGPAGRWSLEVQARSTMELLRGLPPGSSILDVGGGHAQIAPALVAAGFTVTIVGSSVACGAHLETRMPQFANQFLSFKRKVERHTRAFELFDPHEIHQGFVRQGFEVRAERPQFLLPTVLYRMGGSRRLARTAERPGR